MCAGALFAIPAQQQDQTAPPPPIGEHRADPNRQLKMLTRRLTLSVDQQNLLLPILTDREQHLEAVRSDASLSKQERHQRLKGIKGDSETKMRAIFTDAQLDEYDKLIAETQERVRLRRETTTK
jgi:hypothetical protein